MQFLPSKRTARSFITFTLLPTLGFPAVIWLLALSKAGVLAFVTLIAYVYLPLLLAESLGIRNRSHSGTYGSALFEGYIGIGPTFPLGFIFCMTVWFAVGYILWFVIFGLRAKAYADLRN
jgi:hypothetical protein